MERSILAAGHNRDVAADGGGDVAEAWAVAAPVSRVLVAIAAASGAVATLLWFPSAPAIVATGLALFALLAAALVDSVEHRLPNTLVGAAALPVGVAIALALAAGSTDLALGAAAGAAMLGGPLLAAHLVSPAGMGFGDVKAGSVLGAALGLVGAQLAVLALLLALSGAGTYAVARRRRHVALGPGLVAGALVALLLARALGLEAN